MTFAPMTRGTFEEKFFSSMRTKEFASTMAVPPMSRRVPVTVVARACGMMAKQENRHKNSSFLIPKYQVYGGVTVKQAGVKGWTRGLTIPSYLVLFVDRRPVVGVLGADGHRICLPVWPLEGCEPLHLGYVLGNTRGRDITA